MKRAFILLLTVISLLSFSCSGRKDRSQYSDLIPEKQFISILTDIYISDGLLTIPKIHSWVISLDSVATYKQIIELHGYSKEAMDNTVKYYFTHNPKKLIKIYDKVLAILSEMESRAEKEALPEENRLRTLWTGENFYSFPDPSGSDSTTFNITLKKPGLYYLAYGVTLFPDDQTYKPGTSIYYVNADSIATGKKTWLKKYEFIKDGNRHVYRMFIRIQPNKPLSIGGSLFDFENRPVEWGAHADIDSVSLVINSSAK